MSAVNTTFSASKGPPGGLLDLNPGVPSAAGPKLVTVNAGLLGVMACVCGLGDITVLDELPGWACAGICATDNVTLFSPSGVFNM